jgi:PAS domain S-box-containing protein
MCEGFSSAAEQAVDARLRLAIESTGLGLWDHDLRSDAEWWSAGKRALLGLRQTAPIGLEVLLDLVHPEDRTLLEAHIRGALSGLNAGRFQTEYRILRPDDGSERWLGGSGKVFFDEAGAPARILGTVIDITDRKRAEEALRSQEERYRLASRATSDAIWDWDIATDHISWGDASFEFLGGEPGASGAWWKNAIHSDDRGRVVEGLGELIASNADHWCDTYRLRRADGRYTEVFD